MNRMMYALFGGLAGFTLGLGVMLVYLNFVAPPAPPPTIIRYDTTRAIELQQEEAGTEEAKASTVSKPVESENVISVLPREPEGVTVLNKRDEARLTAEPAIAIPEAEESTTATGFGISLGSAASFSALSKRFAEITETNAEMLLDQLEPRATLKDTENGLEAQLMIGPFDTLIDAQQACTSIALPSNIICIAEKFEGELIERQ
ncbi:MAG: hypothetical protein ACR2O0_09005 [Rhizobiaceae bacterium]